MSVPHEVTPSFSLFQRKYPHPLEQFEQAPAMAAVRKLVSKSVGINNNAAVENDVFSLNTR
ncbi:MAG TPA: hypothetical protein VIT91_08795 [Chthoniobacterales bacterium]